MPGVDEHDLNCCLDVRQYLASVFPIIAALVFGNEHELNGILPPYGERRENRLGGREMKRGAEGGCRCSVIGLLAMRSGLDVDEWISHGSLSRVCTALTVVDRDCWCAPLNVALFPGGYVSKTKSTPPIYSYVKDLSHT